MYDSENRVIYYPYFEDSEDLFSILHEMGHYFFRHENNSELTSPRHLTEEILAWSYVFNCVKKEYHKELMELALTCLNTYLIEINTIWRRSISLDCVERRLKFLIEKGE